MPSGVVSGAQLGGVANSLNRGLNIYPTGQRDDEQTLGDPLGGWSGEESIEGLSAGNLSSAQKPLAFRSPDRVGIGKNTIGTWQGFETPWHQRYKSE